MLAFGVGDAHRILVVAVLAVGVAGGCTLLGLAPVPCKSGDDCPPAFTCSNDHVCARGGEGEGGEGEGGEGEGEGDTHAHTCADPGILVEGDNTGDIADASEPTGSQCTVSANPLSEVWRYTASGPTTAIIEVAAANPNDFVNLDMSVRTLSCAGAEVGCKSGTARFLVDLQDGESVFVFIGQRIEAVPYVVRLHAVAPSCGDGVLSLGFNEECDSAVRAACTADCHLATGVPESANNDDGSPATGGINSPDDINDFLAAAATPVAADTTFTASIDPPGDEDEYVIDNSGSGSPLHVVVDTYSGTDPCLNYVTLQMDTVLGVYDVDGVGQPGLISDDRDARADVCSHVDFQVPAGATRYVVVSAFDDDRVIPYYVVQFAFP